MHARGWMVRRGALLAVVAVGLAFSVDHASAQESVATLAVEPANFAIGLEEDEFTIRVTVGAVTAEEGLGGYALVMTYDPEIIEAVSVSDAGLLEGGENPSLCPSSAIENEEGQLAHFCLAVPVIPQPGPRPDEPQVLAEVVFSPVAEGTSDLDISETELLDPEGNELVSTALSGQVTIGEGAVAAPTTPVAAPNETAESEDNDDGNGTNALLWVGLGVGLAVVAVVAAAMFVSLRRRGAT